MTQKRVVEFSMTAEVLSKHLGRDLYRPPEALKQLVANAFDSGAARVDVEVEYNSMDGPARLRVRDDGCGISVEEMGAAFKNVGVHWERPGRTRESIGTRGIGRFAVFSICVEARWDSTADSAQGRTRQRWIMSRERREVEVEVEEAPNSRTGTSIDMTLTSDDDVVWLFTYPARVKRALFNSFAGYLARYQDEVGVWVNGEQVCLTDFVEETYVEDIDESVEVPPARLHHMVLGHQVEQVSPSLLVFASRGATIQQEPLSDEGIPGKKYLGLIDSPYLSELTNTGKSELAEFDAGFRALRGEANRRAKSYLARRRGDRAQSFLERARREPHYPWKSPAKTPVETYTRQLYDGVLLTLEETYRISSTPAQQQKLIFAMTRQILHSDDLASVLTNILGLEGEEVARFAALLKRTSLASVIAVADLLVDRLRFLDELQVLVYGAPAKHVKERSQLHKIIESHTWLLGEQYHLMSSDRTVRTLLKHVSADAGANGDGVGEVDVLLRGIPDLYLASTKWNEGAQYTQHLVVELKRPSVKLIPKHIEQLYRYADAIVNDPVFGQKPDSHRFTFVMVSSDISDDVRRRYEAGKEPGMFANPTYAHPTELWALTWADFLDRRREELRFLSEKIEVTADPELLEYLRERVGDLLPEQLASSS